MNTIISLVHNKGRCLLKYVYLNNRRIISSSHLSRSGKWSLIMVCTVICLSMPCPVGMLIGRAMRNSATSLMKILNISHFCLLKANENDLKEYIYVE